MYKLIACDLDETLIGDNKIIPQENIDAIHRARAKGVKFVPTTGRGYMGVQTILHDLGLHDSESEYVISFNGGALTENRNNRELRFEGISFQTAKRLLEIGNENNICSHVYTDKDLYVYNMNDFEREKLRLDYQELTMPDIDFIENATFAKVLYQSQDHQELMKMEELVTREFGPQLSISYSSNRYVEFNHQGINKGSALHELADMLGIPHEQTIAIGDNINDLAMLHAAGLSVGVANSVQSVLDIVDYVCARDNNQAAVAEVIEKFVL